MNGVYVIKNLKNNKSYIGSTSCINGFKERWKTHKRELRKGIHSNDYLQKSWNKYGEDNFEFEILEKCNKSLCIEREQFYIDTLNPEYNLCKIAGSTLGRKHTEETKKKISQNREYGDPWNKGKSMSNESKLKMSKAQKKSEKSKEHRDKLAKSKRKSVVGTNEIGETIELEYINQDKNFFASGIKRSINTGKSYKGYTWKFKN